MHSNTRQNLTFNERVHEYDEAMRMDPQARRNEIERIVKLSDIDFHHEILEIGVATGALTKKIAEVVKKGVVYACDVSENAIRMLAKENIGDNVKLIHTKNCGQISIKSGSLDRVISLGAFHHIPDEERLDVFKECARVLKTDGLLIIADVMAKSTTQKFFDQVVDLYSKTGHKHNFFDYKSIKNYLSMASFELLNFSHEYSPWKFKSESDLMEFIHKFFSIKISKEMVFTFTEECLGVRENNSSIELGWNLMFIKARKL